MTTTAAIRTFCEARLASIANIPDVAVQGAKFTKTITSPWVRFTLLPAESVNNSIGDNPILTLNGLAQIDVYYPPMRGVVDAETTAQSILDSFKPAVHLIDGDQFVIDSAWVGPIREEPGWINLPVLIRWKAFRL